MPAGVVLATVAAAVALLGFATVVVNRAQGCAIGDAPYAASWCAPPETQTAADLQRRLRRNPADIDAMKLYAAKAGPDQAPGVLSVLVRHWPLDPQVLAMQAASAAEHNDWPRMAAALVRLVTLHHSDPAALAIARMLGVGGAPLLAAHQSTAGAWLKLVLASLKPAGVHPTAATPLVAQALRTKSLEPAVAMHFVAQLQAASAWVDAHAIWTALHGGAVPMLYNAGFDDPFIANGFDWEIPAQRPGARSGAVVERMHADRRGTVLAVRFNGKRFNSPLARQHVFVGGGQATLRGDYATRQLRSDKGLAWTARCPASGAVAGRSPALHDTGLQWKRFELAIDPPPGCGPVVTVQLEPFDAVEAETGVLGLVQFDSFELDTTAGMRR